MTERQKTLDNVTDNLYYYMMELVSQAGVLEEIGMAKEGDELRSIADTLERFSIRLLDRMHSKHR